MLSYFLLSSAGRPGHITHSWCPSVRAHEILCELHDAALNNTTGAASMLSYKLLLSAG